MAVPSARRPAGRGLGALAGDYPDPALGLPPAVGLAIWDDFYAPREIVPSERVEARFGDLLWATYEIGGGNSTFAGVVPIDWSAIGILQMSTPAQGTRGPTLFFTPVAPFFRFPPPGSVWCVKMRLTSGTVNYELWSGFASSEQVRVETTIASQFVGVRSTGGNMFGVVKNGANSETVVDLGVSVEGSVWRILGLEIGGTTAAPTIQFFRLDPLASNREKYDRLDVGPAITTTLPTVPLTPIAAGLVTTSNFAKTMQIDFWSLGGRAARG